MKKGFLKVVLSVVALTSILVSAATAENCFKADGTLAENAQVIRKKAGKMGWVVGKSASIAAATVVKGKKEIYPQDQVEVCLRVENNVLEIRAQSHASDAGKAEWHKLPGKHHGEK